MENPVVEKLSTWVKRQQEDAEQQKYINEGRRQAYEEVVNRFNQSCITCGEYFYILDRLAEHIENKHPKPLPDLELPVIEVPSYGSSG